MNLRNGTQVFRLSSKRLTLSPVGVDGMFTGFDDLGDTESLPTSGQTPNEN